MVTSFARRIQSFLLILALSTCFTRALDLKAKIEKLERNYIQIELRLERKIADLEAKVSRLEAKVEEQDSLLVGLKRGRKPLKDNIDMNQHLRQNAILRTCHEIHIANPSYDSGMYWIDPDGQGIGDPPIHVYCDMKALIENEWNKGQRIQPGMTSIMHDSESQIKVEHCTEPGCHSRPIKYYASDGQMAALIRLSNNCEQHIVYNCRNSPLNYNGIAYAWWNGKHGKRHGFSNWLTSCDQLSAEQHSDNGVVKDDRLPFTSFHFSNAFQGSGEYRVSRLQCNGKTNMEAMPASCEDLWRMGHILNGIYSVMGANQIETVYCQFHKRPNEKGFQKWIGYVDVKSFPTYFHVQKNRMFTKEHVPIPFETEHVNVGKAMNLKSGIFTAARDGIYFFSFTGLASASPTKGTVYVGVGIFLNAKQVGKAWVHEADISQNHDSPLTLQSTLKLKANDRVWLQITSSAESSFLFDNHHGFNHFTGFMLHEETTKSLL